MRSNSKSIFPDPKTGRQIHQLTRGGISLSPYFNSLGWTPEGDWVFYLGCAGGEVSVRACEVDSGETRLLGGPFALEQASAAPWSCLKALPDRRGVSFVMQGAVWVAELEGGEAERVALLPDPQASTSDSDISGDGRWHYLPCTRISEEARQEMREVGWPPDEVYERHGLRSTLVRVDLREGRVEELWEEPTLVSHVGVSPTDPDLVLFCHEGNRPFHSGRMFRRRVGEATARPLRDQRSRRVRVTHERWFADGQRIAYHGSYLAEDRATRVRDYVGIFEVERDLPHEYLLRDPAQRAWHSSPDPEGRRLIMDQPYGKGVSVVTPDPGSGYAEVEEVVSLHSDESALPNGQWRESDPIWSPEGRRVLFRVARKGEVEVFVAEVG